jgi:hypothetical protein
MRRHEMHRAGHPPKGSGLASRQVRAGFGDSAVVLVSFS